VQTCKYCGLFFDNQPNENCPNDSGHRTYYFNLKTKEPWKNPSSLIGTELDPIFDDDSDYDYGEAEGINEESQEDDEEIETEDSN